MMQALLMMSVVPLIISLSGCQTTPRELIQYQRFIHFKTVEVEGKKFIDPESAHCLEREYKYSIDFIGPREKFRDVPIEKCNKLNGYDPESYVRVTNFLDDVREEIQSYE